MCGECIFACAIGKVALYVAGGGIHPKRVSCMCMCTLMCLYV